MREADRQSNRRARERLEKQGEHIVRTAHKLGGKAQAVTHESDVGAHLSAEFEIPKEHFAEFKHEVDEGFDV